MKNILIIAALLILGVLGALFFSQRYLGGSFLPFMKTSTATINNQTFDLLIAKTPEEKQIGLSEKTSLPQNAGMLFPFETPGNYPFWMKNMKFAIDIIYIRDNKIITIFKNAQPAKSPTDSLPVYNSEEPADTVLEINAGLSDKYNFKKGDEVEIKNG